MMNTQHTQQEGGLRMEIGQQEFKVRGGQIILHKRADDRHGVWQCRLRLGRRTDVWIWLESEVQPPEIEVR